MEGKVKVEAAALVVLVDDIKRVGTQHARVVAAVAREVDFECAPGAIRGRRCRGGVIVCADLSFRWAPFSVQVVPVVICIARGAMKGFESTPTRGIFAEDPSEVPLLDQQAQGEVRASVASSVCGGCSARWR